MITNSRWDVLATLQSTLHYEWARKYSSSLETRLRYTPSDVFETYPFPENSWGTTNPELAEIGERYHKHRRALMLRLWLGLTDIYNLFHDRDLTPAEVARVSKKPAEADAGYAGILQLRALHRELDEAVLAAYDWAGQVALGHDFQEVETLPENDRVRYTITPAARKELLRRLLALNHERAAEEKAQAASTPKTAQKPRAPKAPKPTSADELPDLFGIPVPAEIVQAPITSVRAWQDDVFRHPQSKRHAKLDESIYVRLWVHASLALQPEGLTGIELFNAFRLLLSPESRKLIASSGDSDGKKWSHSFDQPVSLLGFFSCLISLAQNREIERHTTDGKHVFRRTTGWHESPSDWVRADAEITQRALLDKALNDQLLPFIEPTPLVIKHVQDLERAFA
ncbi:MAG: hypothetical protein NTU80_00925 [Verrucomicrobia bacterium]|nr:hypothetical protein [Verrucomicrobiota bacterium]